MSRNPNTRFAPPPSALVAGMASGDDRALGALYDAYSHLAFGLALAITGEQTSAESVVNDAFAEAWRSAASFDASRTSVLAWLTAIVRRTALQKARNRAEQFRTYNPIEDGVGAPMSRPTPMREAAQRVDCITAPSDRAFVLSRPYRR